MPSQHEVRWSQLKVGVIVLISTVILVALLFLMTSSSGLGIFTHKLTVVTYFENSAGLKTGAETVPPPVPPVAVKMNLSAES